MKTNRTATQEAAEDIFFGQVVIIWARWFFILGGAILALWSAKTVAEITATIVLVVILMATNFFVHTRYLMEKPANRLFLMAVSLLDFLIVTALVLDWQGRGGFANQFYIFYYPLLFSFALVFSPRLTAAYTLLALSLYTVACFWVDFSVIATQGNLVIFIMRLITLAAMGGLGTYYWRIQRERRRTVTNPLAA